MIEHAPFQSKTTQTDTPSETRSSMQYIPVANWQAAFERWFDISRLRVFAAQVGISSASREHEYLLGQLQQLNLFNFLRALPAVDSRLFRIARRQRSGTLYRRARYLPAVETGRFVKTELQDFLCTVADAFVIARDLMLHTDDADENERMTAATAHTFVVVGDVEGLLTVSDVSEGDIEHITVTLFRLVSNDEFSSRLAIDTATVAMHSTASRASDERHSTEPRVPNEKHVATRFTAQLPSIDADKGSPADAMYILLTEMYSVYFTPPFSQLTVTDLVDTVEYQLLRAIYEQVARTASLRYLYTALVVDRQIINGGNVPDQGPLDDVLRNLHRDIVAQLSNIDTPTLNELSEQQQVEDNVAIIEFATRVRLAAVVNVKLDSSDTSSAFFQWVLGFYDLFWAPVVPHHIALLLRERTAYLKREDERALQHAQVYDPMYNRDDDDDYEPPEPNMSLPRRSNNVFPSSDDDEDEEATEKVAPMNGGRFGSESSSVVRGDTLMPSSDEDENAIIETPTKVRRTRVKAK